MNPRMALLASLLLSAVAAFAASGCEGGAGPTKYTTYTPTPVPLYGSCRANSECQSGLCLTIGPSTSSYPTQACSQPCDGTCPSGGACGTAPDGSMKCLPSCTTYENGQYVCSGGVEVPCSVAGDSHCDVCGCPSSLRCAPGQGCVDKSDVGGPCASDSDCKTDNCSSISNVCRVPVGQACTQDNCDLCRTNGTNYSFCSRDCTSDSDCNGSYCLGYATSGYTCMPKCTAGCPDSCQYTSDLSEQYCDCTSCTTLTPNAGLGQSCSQANCSTGACYSAAAGAICTKGCSSSADCGAGFECVNLPCELPGAAPNVLCGQCMPACGDGGACKVGSCQPESLGSSQSTACDVRGDPGAQCYQGNDCLSGRCVCRTCVAAGGAANGQCCVAPSDCASGNCAAGSCQGTALIGGHCSSSSDCEVGTCCSAGPNAGTCETQC
jgi:hypothetical protein